MMIATLAHGAPHGPCTNCDLPAPRMITFGEGDRSITVLLCDKCWWFLTESGKLSSAGCSVCHPKIENRNA